MAASVVDLLRARGVRVGLRGSEIHFLVDGGRMTPDLRAFLERERDAIGRELRRANRPGQRRSWGGDGVEADDRIARAVAAFSGRHGLWDRASSEFVQELCEAVTERAAILEYDAGLPRSEAEARALATVPSQCDAERRRERPSSRFEDAADFGSLRAAHDPPARGCYCCGGREFVRVRGGPMWFCPRCHPPQFEGAIVERTTAPEPSWGEARHA